MINAVAQTWIHVRNMWSRDKPNDLRYYSTRENRRAPLHKVIMLLALWGCMSADPSIRVSTCNTVYTPV